MLTHILIADDDASLRRVLQYKLKQNGYEVSLAEDGLQALDKLKNNNFDLLLCDMKMPGVNGIEVLEKSKTIQPDLEVIMITAHATIGQAVEAIKLGAFDYLTKPFDDNQLFAVMEKALRFKKLEDENKYLKERLSGSEFLKKVIGISKPFKDMMYLTDKVAPTDATVLLTGESGTGKEVIARTIHIKSARVNGPFVAINCSAIPRELIESELFGHIKGGFTGAIKDKKGKFELANGGTLLLDEVSELPLELQAKLLRIIQERMVEPVGSETTREIDIRLIAATNVDLKRRIAEGRFREDLFYRLNILPIEIPSLRARPDDIPVLLKEFLVRFGKDQSISVDDNLLEKLMHHKWPGNIRELENLTERMVILRKSNLLTPNDLPDDFGEITSPVFSEIVNGGDNLSFHESEKKLVIEALEKNSWNKTKAAKYLQIPRHVIIYRIKKYNLKPPEAG